MLKQLLPTSKILAISIFFLSILVVALGAMIALVLCNQNHRLTTTTYKLSKDNFSVVATYQGDNKWHYKLQAMVAPCGNIDVTPEKADDSLFLAIKITYKSENNRCTANLLLKEIEGNFNAAPNVDLSIRTDSR